MSAIVILGSSITALAVARDAHVHGLTPVVVDDNHGVAMDCRWATPVVVNRNDDDATAAAVLALASRQTHLIATGDSWLRFVAAHRMAFEGAFASILHPCNRSIDICLDKGAFAAWCADNGLLAPMAWLPDTQPRPDNMRLPLLVRPLHTLHVRRELLLPKAAEVQSERDLQALLERFRIAGVAAIVSESLLSHRLTQYSVPFSRNRDTVAFVARKVRPDASRCAVGTLVEITTQPEIERIGRLAAERLDYFGVGEAEFLYSHDNGRSYLIEINARPWLQYALAPAGGYDFLGLLLGTEISGTPARVRGTPTWINFGDDLFVSFSRSVGMVRHGQVALLTYLRTLLRSNVYATLDRRDLRPFLRSIGLT